MPLRRRILDALIGAASLTLLCLIVLTIDGRAGDQMTRFVHANAVSGGGAVAQLHQGVSHVTRSAMELSYVYGPLMTFTAVAAVLLVVMTRTR